MKLETTVEDLRNDIDHSINPKLYDTERDALRAHALMLAIKEPHHPNYGSADTNDWIIARADQIMRWWGMK